LARRYGFDVLIVIGAIESALEAALHQDAVLEQGTTAWVVVPVVPFVVLPLLMRRRFPFAAPLAVWLVAAGLSSIDGKLVTSLGVLFAAGMAAAFLLGNLQNAVEGRIGLVVTLGAAVIVTYNDPDHGTGEFLINPGLFAIAWVAGFALRERSAQAESSEERALEAERELLAERVRIARELHDVVAHHVSMMGVQAGAARVVIDRDPGEAKNALSAIETSSRQAVAELHRLLGFLRQRGDEDDLAPQPGVEQLGNSSRA
jgi:signal transduction histidine kinase